MRLYLSPLLMITTFCGLRFRFLPFIVYDFYLIVSSSLFPSYLWLTLLSNHFSFTVVFLFLLAIYLSPHPQLTTHINSFRFHKTPSLSCLLRHSQTRWWYGVWNPTPNVGRPKMAKLSELRKYFRREDT